MEIKNFTYEGMSLGNIEIKDVAVAATKATDASAAYKCAVTGKGTVSINLNGVPLTADVEVSGTVANDKADIKIVVDAAGLKVNVGFAGDKIGADTPDYALDIAGDYTGKMIVTVGDTPVGPTKQEIVFARQNENVVQMSMEDFSFGGASLGKIVLSDVTVTKKDAGYTVAGEGDVKVSLGGSPLTVKVTLEGTVEDKATELVMTINVPGVGDVKAEFTGAIEYVPSDLAELLSIEFADNAKVAVQPATTDGKNYTFCDDGRRYGRRPERTGSDDRGIGNGYRRTGVEQDRSISRKAPWILSLRPRTEPLRLPIRYLASENRPVWPASKSGKKKNYGVVRLV